MDVGNQPPSSNKNQQQQQHARSLEKDSTSQIATYEDEEDDDGDDDDDDDVEVEDDAEEEQEERGAVGSGETRMIPTLSLNHVEAVIENSGNNASSGGSLTSRTGANGEELTLEQLIHQYASLNKAQQLRTILLEEKERLRQLEDDDLNLSALMSDLVNCTDSKDNSTALHKAAAKNNCEVLELLLKEFRETKIDAKDTLDSTPLHWACANNALEAIFMLCKFGASINVRDRYGYAPIHLTVKKKCFRGADVLLLYNADINFKMSNGSTALHLACENNELETVKWLLKKEKINPNSRDKLKETPILRAATKGNMEIIDYFLNNNIIQWNLRDDKKQSLLHKAAYYGYNDLIMRIANANPVATNEMMNEQDKDGNTPLHLAVRKDHFRAMKSLLLMGAEMNTQNKHGDTPLHMAVQLKDYKTARYLHQSNANPDIKNKKNRSPRDIAALHAKDIPPNTVLKVHEDPTKIFV